EFVGAVLFVPTVVSIIWFGVFGMTGVTVGQVTPGGFDMAPETQLFAIFNELPMGALPSIVAVVLVPVLFITSAGSATFVLGMQTTFGSLTPPGGVKIVWGFSLSAIVYILLLAGGETGLNALQSAAIIAALPFSVVVI